VYRNRIYTTRSGRVRLCNRLADRALWKSPQNLWKSPPRSVEKSPRIGRSLWTDLWKTDFSILMICTDSADCRGHPAGVIPRQKDPLTGPAAPMRPRRRVSLERLAPGPVERSPTVPTGREDRGRHHRPGRFFGCGSSKARNVCPTISMAYCSTRFDRQRSARIAFASLRMVSTRSCWRARSWATPSAISLDTHAVAFTESSHHSPSSLTCVQAFTASIIFRDCRSIPSGSVPGSVMAHLWLYVISHDQERDPFRSRVSS
jgi:hypothetical protein